MKEYRWLLEKLNIDKTQITKDLTPYYNKILSHPNREGLIIKQWGSVEQYIDCLYWMKFVMKLNRQEMNSISETYDFYKKYVTIGWDYNSNSFDEVIKMHQAELENIRNKIAQFDKNDPSIYDNEEYRRKKKGLKNRVIINRFYTPFHVNTLYEMFDLLYFLAYVIKLSNYEIALYYEVDPATIMMHLRNCNLNMPAREGMKRSISTRKDLTRSRITWKENLYKAALSTGNIGNKSENLLRGLIEVELYKYISLQEFSFIVGLSSQSIVSPYEIDIPIVIFSKKTDTIYKYGIELNGDFFHKRTTVAENDIFKEEIMKKNGWKLIVAQYEATEAVSEKRIKDAITSFTEQIVQLISNDITGKLDSWTKQYIRS